MYYLSKTVVLFVKVNFDLRDEPISKNLSRRADICVEILDKCGNFGKMWKFLVEFFGRKRKSLVETFGGNFWWKFFVEIFRLAFIGYTDSNWTVVLGTITVVLYTLVAASY